MKWQNSQLLTMSSSQLTEPVLVIGECAALGHRLVSELFGLEIPSKYVYVSDLDTE